MPRPEAILDLLVVARALILVLDQQTDRRARGPALEDTRQNTHRVGLAPLAGELRQPGAAPLDIRLYICLGQRQPRRTAVHHAAQRRAVAFAKTRHREHSTEGITCHALAS